MKILYHCYGGSHSSVTAAAIHLGMLPSYRVPTAKEFMQVPYFDVQLQEEHGEFKFMGQDEFENDIYIMGRRNLGPLLQPLLEGVADILAISRSELLLVDSLPSVNNLMRIGGFLSRRMGWVLLGRPLVILGTQAAYWDFVNVVQTVKHVKIPYHGSLGILKGATP